jgi:hypothetical protein
LKYKQQPIQAMDELLPSAVASLIARLGLPMCGLEVISLLISFVVVGAVLPKGSHKLLSHMYSYVVPMGVPNFDGVCP